MTNDGTTDHHALYTLMITNVCAVSHYVKHLDEAQTIAEYDYHWCYTHGCICDPDGCRWGDGYELLEDNA